MIVCAFIAAPGISPWGFFFPVILPLGMILPSTIRGGGIRLALGFAGIRLGKTEFDRAAGILTDQAVVQYVGWAHQCVCVVVVVVHGWLAQSEHR